MNRRRMLGILGTATFAAARAARRAAAAGRPTIRIGVLQFGSVAWQLDVVRRHGLAEVEGKEVASAEIMVAPETKTAPRAGAAG